MIQWVRRRRPTLRLFQVPQALDEIAFLVRRFDQKVPTLRGYRLGGAYTEWLPDQNETLPQAYRQQVVIQQPGKPFTLPPLPEAGESLPQYFTQTRLLRRGENSIGLQQLEAGEFLGQVYRQAHLRIPVPQAIGLQILEAGEFLPQVLSRAQRRIPVPQWSVQTLQDVIDIALPQFYGQVRLLRRGDSVIGVSGIPENIELFLAPVVRQARLLQRGVSSIGVQILEAGEFLSQVMRQAQLLRRGESESLLPVKVDADIAFLAMTQQAQRLRRGESAVGGRAALENFEAFLAQYFRQAQLRFAAQRRQFTGYEADLTLDDSFIRYAASPAQQSLFRQRRGGVSYNVMGALEAGFITAVESPYIPVFRPRRR